MEKAPKLVQVCYRSIQQHLQDREVVLLTEENIGQYVSLPDDIVKKHYPHGTLYGFVEIGIAHQIWGHVDGRDSPLYRF